MGALDHFSDLFDCSRGSSKLKRRKQLQYTPLSRFQNLSGYLVFMCVDSQCNSTLPRKIHFSDLIDFRDQTVEVKVRIDCEGCERKANKVTVVGYVDPSKVVSRVAHRTGKKAELWPYVPYDMVAHPYAQGVYDRKAPTGYVRRVDDPQLSQLARASSTEVRYTTAFSDENTQACAIM
ncbi:hypothetical protein Pint_34304 [Pistacia integerrima]|uniref:Uncharacterized protein n=1 Tax=Pistacia integerrima TaxID=434235 RepID=A0ACC0X5R0_9ROSI|nr:hypothetical protein Pint_34304 [Pistacia integerrima]